MGIEHTSVQLKYSQLQPVARPFAGERGTRGAGAAAETVAETALVLSLPDNSRRRFRKTCAIYSRKVIKLSY